jgi:drug/metabolite transporter (DMT)-like permease
MRHAQGALLLFLAMFQLKWSFVLDRLPDGRTIFEPTPPLGSVLLYGIAAVYAVLGLVLLTDAEIGRYRRKPGASPITFTAVALWALASFATKFAWSSQLQAYVPPFSEEWLGIAYVLCLLGGLYFFLVGEFERWRNRSRT